MQQVAVAKDSRRPGDGSPSTYPPGQKVKAEFVLTGAQVNDTLQTECTGRVGEHDKGMPTKSRNV